MMATKETNVSTETKRTTKAKPTTNKATIAKSTKMNSKTTKTPKVAKAKAAKKVSKVAKVNKVAKTTKAKVSETKKLPVKTTKSNLNETLWIKKDVLDSSRKWFQIDAQGATLWKLATTIANILSWKNKVHYCDFWDCWDFVVVNNIDKLVVTWNKAQDKKYYYHSGYRGNMKVFNFNDLMNRKPQEILFLAVKWMLPKNNLRDGRMKRLKLFTTPTTKFDYLSPEKIDV